MGRPPRRRGEVLGGVLAEPVTAQAVFGAMAPRPAGPLSEGDGHRFGARADQVGGPGEPA